MGTERSRLVAVIGLDGSGKSTLVRGLADELAGRGYRVARLHVWPKLSAGPLGRPRSVDPQKERTAELPRLPAWRAGALVLLLFYLLRVRLPRLRRRFDYVICDRFVHDLVTYLRLRGRGRAAAVLLRIGASLEPEAIFRLHVPVEVLVERKGSELEHPLPVYARWDRLYAELEREMAAWKGKTHRLAGRRPPGELVREACARLGLPADRSPVVGA
jgi:thymidylate kinase